MTKGSSVRQADYPIDKLFLDRWSPRAMSAEEIPVEELMLLLEAARWAPSSFNNQPWRIVYARRNTEHWKHLFELLAEPNKIWVKDAAALLVFVSKTTFDHNGEPSRTHTFDCGAAWENLALQGALKGLVVHGMQGFDYEKAKTELGVPEGYTVEAMVAIGRPGKKETLPEKLQERENPSDRKKLSETVFEGRFKT